MNISDIPLETPPAFPPMPAGIVKHPQLGELFDRLQVQQYALRYAEHYMAEKLKGAEPHE